VCGHPGELPGVVISELADDCRNARASCQRLVGNQKDVGFFESGDLGLQGFGRRRPWTILSIM